MTAATRVGAIEVTLEPNATQTFTMTVTSVTEGNLLVAICIVKDADAGSTLTLSGWTKIGQAGGTGANASESYIGAWWKVASSEPASYEITSDGAVNMRAVSMLFEINGADNTTPIHQSLIEASEGGSVSTLVASEVTPTLDECYCICAFSIAEATDGPFSSAGTNWTETLDADTNRTGPDQWDASGPALEQTQSTAAATNDVTLTPTTNIEGAWLQLAIAPAAGDAPLVLYTSPGLSVTNP